MYLGEHVDVLWYYQRLPELTTRQFIGLKTPTVYSEWTATR